MAELKAFKVTGLPGTMDAHALYFVENGNYCETYLTDAAGVAKLVGNSSMITQIAGTGQAEVMLVEDIPRRDALVLVANATVYVQDATADGTVTAGGAFYFYDNVADGFIKLAEFESMDVTLTWANIQGKPTSTVASIDQAVTDSHTHANKAALDAITGAGSGVVISTTERNQIGTNATAIGNLQADSHVHANKAQLDKVSEISGIAAYDGEEVKNWNQLDW